MRVRRVLAATAVSLGLGVAFAAPAQADHVVDIIQVGGGDTCRLGGLTSGIGVDVLGRVVQHKVADGVTTRFTCQFRDVPKYVSPDDSMIGEEWVMPKNGFHATVWCWAPGGGDGTGQLRVTPSGNATVDCRF